MPVLAPESRLAEIVRADLPKAPPRPPKAPSQDRSPKTWTQERVNYDKTEVPPKSFLDRTASERGRAHILVRLGDAPCPSHAQLQKELGWGHRSAVGWHINRLVDESLVVKLSGKCVLTPAGRACRAYLMAYAGGESVWRRVIRVEFGLFSQRAAAAIRDAGRELDAKYSLERAGLVRRRRAGEGQELERKVTCRELIRALRGSCTNEAAASKCGLASGAMRDRIATLIRHARRLMDGAR